MEPDSGTGAVKRFPRVLIVTKSQIGDIDSAGAALRSWFKEWPRDGLAQIFSGGAPVAKEFCGRSFQLGPAERRMGRFFFGLKNSSLADSALPYRKQEAGLGRGGLLSKLRRSGGKALVESGAWELIFRPTLSPRLRTFIEDFRPEAMFVQGCDITFMELPLLIHSVFGTPIHFDVVDDWVKHLYRRSWLGPLLGNVVDRTFRRLLAASEGRYAIGHAMALEYRTRYGMPFQTLMQCDDPERFTVAGAGYSGDERTVRIVYSGSLALGRWKGIVDLAHACQELGAQGWKPSIAVYAPFVPGEADGPLRAAPGVALKDAAPDGGVPEMLAAADLLFLPESFDAATSDYIKLSVSTKAHLYMMSRRPALVYGPAGIGTVEYARAYGWACVVDQEGPGHLAAALRALLSDPGRREALVARAAGVASEHHSGAVVRDALRRALLATCR